MTGVSAEDTAEPDLYTTAGKLADLKRRYHETVIASGEAAIEKQHKRGKKRPRVIVRLAHHDLEARSLRAFDDAED